MKALYVAPRYHTNQVPIMRGWLKRGHQVIFISQITSEGEDHKDLIPVVLGYSFVFQIFFKIICKIKKINHPDDKFAYSSKKGFPPYFKLKKIIKEFKPDVAILRERSLYNIVAFYICKKYKIPCILYNQTPYWEPIKEKGVFLRNIVRVMSPSYRMTPVMGKKEKGTLKNDKVFFVPFIMEPVQETQNRKYCENNAVELLCVGRYMKCKNQHIQLQVLKELVKKHAVHMTFVGEVTDASQKAYYDGLKEYIRQNELENYVTMYTNLSHERVYEEYKKADIFLLPSVEPASVSQLEAMACSLPAICSNVGGQADYIQDGVNGFLVRPGSVSDLKKCIEILLNDKEKIGEMGRASYKLVTDKYSFDNYFFMIDKIICQIKKEELKK